MKHKFWKLATCVALLLSLFFVSCKKDEWERNLPTVDPVLIETLQLNFTPSLAAEWYGDWGSCGRALDPSYFLNEDLPSELRDNDYFIDITQGPLPGYEKWSNERLRTIYRTVFEHAQKHADLFQQATSVSEHRMMLASFLTPLYMQAGEQILKVSADLTTDHKLSCSVYGKRISIEFRPNRIVIADTHPFRWIVLKRKS